MDEAEPVTEISAPEIYTPNEFDENIPPLEVVEPLNSGEPAPSENQNEEVIETECNNVAQITNAVELVKFQDRFSQNLKIIFNQRNLWRMLKCALFFIVAMKIADELELFSGPLLQSCSKTWNEFKTVLGLKT